MDATARKLLNLRKKMESESGVKARDLVTNVVCFFHDVAKAPGYSDRNASRITRDRLVDEPIWPRKRRPLHARRRS